DRRRGGPRRRAPVRHQRLAPRLRRLDHPVLIESMTPTQAPTSRATAAARLVLPRLVGALIVVWGAATLAFLVLQFVPGDPVNIMLGTDATARDALRAQLRADMGLDRPVATQYLAYLGRVATFDLGESYRLHQRVTTVIGAQIVPTLQLAGLAIVLAVGIAGL